MGSEERHRSHGSSKWKPCHVTSLIKCASRVVLQNLADVIDGDRWRCAVSLLHPHSYKTETVVFESTAGSSKAKQLYIYNVE